MLKFFAGMVASLLLVAMLAASDAGFSVAWEFELKRPETQKALNHYISQHCQLVLHPYDIKRLSEEMKTPDAAWEYYQLDCREDH